MASAKKRSSMPTSSNPPPSSSALSVQTPQGNIQRPSSSLSRPSSSLSHRSSSRPPSSAGQRSPSSAGPRPSSSSGQKPSSSSAPRPPSSAGYRPPSSLSTTRPASSASTRPRSRFSQRPNSRHARSRLIPQCQTLVFQVTGMREEGSEGDIDGENFRTTVDFVVKNLEATTLNKAAASVDMGVIDRQIDGHALKARLDSKDVLGEALEVSYKQLKTHMEKDQDLDQEIQLSRLPDHLQFLIKLSLPSTSKTVAYAGSYLEQLKNPPPPPPTLTWNDILAEEPFEGEHWEGVYGLPHGSVRSSSQKGKDSRDEWGSTPSLSPLNSDDLALDDDEEAPLSSLEPLSPPSAGSGFHIPSDTQDTKRTKPPHTYAHRKDFEDLQAKQYWRKEWRTDINARRKFDIGDPSTLGPAMESVMATGRAGLAAQTILRQEKYIDEEVMVREVLIAMQGRNNILFSWKDGTCTTTPSTPRLIHLTLASQASMLSSLAQMASTVQRLRQFVSVILSQSRHKISTSTGQRKVSVTRTCEAFADAVDHEIRILDAWCAHREELICRATAGLCEEQLIVSLLSTEKALRDAFETTFEVLLDIVTQVFGKDVSDVISSHSNRRQPAATTTLLLDTLFGSVQSHLERGDTVTSDALMRVFVLSAEPIWGMIGKWLRDGMGLGLAVGRGHGSDNMDELDDEFFIESSGVGIGMMGMGLLDPEFWKEGYTLREGVEHIQETGSTANKRAIPSFLEHVAAPVLSAGKAIGLIRALGVLSSTKAVDQWRSFAEVIPTQTNGLDANKRQKTRLFSISIDTLSRLVYDGLSSRCGAAGSLLATLLVDECALWRHLNAIEDLFLMRKGDAMSHFIDVLFAKMDTQQSWADFHFLNTAFNDVVQANSYSPAQEWIQPSLVRLIYRGGTKDKDKTINRTVKAIDGLLTEYAVPFPLTYIFRPELIRIYGDIFVFLLQIRRAKSVLERILVRRENGRDDQSKNELKVFYAMRSRLSWFINTLLNFLTTYVVHIQVLKFHEDLKAANSLDDMIHFHDEHLDKIQGRCLLKPNTSALHRAIISILDMSLHFSEAFVAFAGETNTHDVSQLSISMKKHRSRRQRRQRRNVVGFSQPTKDADSSSDEDEDDIDPVAAPESFFSVLAFSFVSSDENAYSQIDKMSSELDSLVRFVRRGVESLAGGSSEAAPAFGVLAFALEDWDL
ncbi:Spc98 family-domain-containing protein [Crucibulum laeve]|uniref:Spc98 family-domain-containing protein n=1 Tax=Crucibulum laeve TaxID=68775 RepID=A0A5C3MEM9_9AGAR|nr:Spc98 family-domain-containing protein [Crucibulum laeve]